MTPRQQEFVRQYLVDLNASAAYQRAGYRSRGNAAEVAACRLLRNVQIKQAIAEAQSKRAVRTELSADWVVKRLRREAGQKGKGASHSARVRALELLGKHLGIFEEDNSQKGATAVGQVLIVEAEVTSEKQHAGNPEANGAASGPDSVSSV